MLNSINCFKDQTIARILTKFPWLFKHWGKNANVFEFQTIPWSNLKKPISQSKIVLITTSGIREKDQKPFDMNNQNGDGTFREISAKTTKADLSIEHNYYDHRDADKDCNVVFPLERLKQLKTTGEIGSINHRHFSFMGHLLNDQLDLLVNQSIPRLVEILRSDEVDIAILSPA